MSRRKKEAASLFLADLAIVLLSGIDPAMAPQLASVTARMKKDVIQRWGDDYPHLVSCKNVIDTLGRKLLDCEDDKQIMLALNNVDALNTGNIFLAADDQEVIMVEPG